MKLLEVLLVSGLCQTFETLRKAMPLRCQNFGNCQPASKWGGGLVHSLRHERSYLTGWLLRRLLFPFGRVFLRHFLHGKGDRVSRLVQDADICDALLPVHTLFRQHTAEDVKRA